MYFSLSTPCLGAQYKSCDQQGHVLAFITLGLLFSKCTLLTYQNAMKNTEILVLFDIWNSEYEEYLIPKEKENVYETF